MRHVWRLSLVCILGGGLVGCAWLFPPPQAVLTADVTSGPAPLNVTFSAAGSSGKIISFTVDFETDGVVDFNGTDITQGVAHQYSTAGNYVAKLTVLDNRGRSSTESRTITVLPGTSASLSVSPNPVTEGVAVTFILQGNAASGRSLASWKLWADYTVGGDPDWSGTISGTTLYYTFGTHAYAAVGEYVARLEVKDSADQVAVASLTVIVTSAPPEIEEFSATVGMNSVSFYDTPPILTIGVGVTVDFGLVAAASTGRQIVSYTLDCPGSNVISSTIGVTPTGLLTASGIMREYNTVGEYVATLTVWDDEDRTDTVTVVIEVLQAI